MTKRELLNFLEPFVDEVEVRVCDEAEGIWKRIMLEAHYSARTGKTTIYVKPSTLQGKESTCGMLAVFTEIDALRSRVEQLTRERDELRQQL